MGDGPRQPLLQIDREGLRASHVEEIVRYVSAMLKAAVLGESATVTFGVDPANLIAAIEHGRLPAVASAGNFPVRVAPN